MHASNYYTTIVIGGGPAGLFAAANLPSNSTLLVDRKESFGKKLLISGSGQCNFTHSGSVSDFLLRYGSNGKFLRAALMEFTNVDAASYFKGRGVDYIEDKNGKLFPRSGKARDILKVLVDACGARGVVMNVSTEVLTVSFENEIFEVATSKGLFWSKNLVIATGGCSYPTTGSTGDGFKFAASLGHSIVEPRPSLAPVFVRNYQMAELSGVSLESVQISLFRDGRKVGSHVGPIGFTHKGLSGPAIIDFSRCIRVNDELRINFTGISPDAFREHFIQSVSKQGRTTIQSFLRVFDMPKNLVRFILDELGVDTAACISNIDAKRRNRLIQLFCDYPFTIDQVGGFKVAMATAGGVSLSEISAKTMESKICKGLYFAGEVVDIDGDTGGYNIQAALSTGYLAAKHISQQHTK